VWGTRRESSFVRDREGSENGRIFHRGLVLGNMAGGCSFPRDFERRVRLFLSGELLLGEYERHIRVGSGNGQLSP